MSLIRQFWLLLATTLLVAVCGSAFVSIDAARSSLQTQLRLKNSDNAQALALTLSQQRGDAALLALAITAQFDTGSYERIRLVSPEGREVVLHERVAGAAQAPGWFVRAVPLRSEPGVAQVSDGWRALGTLEVTSAPGFAYTQLWQGTLRTAGLLLLLGAVAAALGASMLARLRKPLAATVAQAQALVERRFVTVPEPAVPELRQLSRAMNSMVTQLQAVLAEQTTQIDMLQTRTRTDELTGLAHRAHFMATAASLLQREDGPARGSLALLRVCDLANLNRELGHHTADEVLRTMSKALMAAAGDETAGRLNGADMALFQRDVEPAELAAALHAAVQNVLKPWPQVRVALGAVAWQHGAELAQVLQRVDEALARAEAGAGVVFEPATPTPADGQALAGEAAWRRSLLVALQSGAGELGAYPLVTSQGQIIHLEAPLRLRLVAGAPAEPAARWLPWALRSRLQGDADLLAVRLALAHIAADGRPRGVNLAGESITSAGFVARLRDLLATQPAAAATLSVEVGERAALADLPLLRELAAQIRPLGVKLGVEHVGTQLAQTERLFQAQVDYVKLDAAMSLGLHNDAARAELLRRLVSMLHGMGLQVYAEGVRNADDAAALWACGADGITGPWVGSVA